MSSLALCLLMTLAGYLSGSILYGEIIVRRRGAGDVRDWGDGTPGAFNTAKAAGFGWGVTAAVLDIAKAAVPVLFARTVLHLDGWLLVPVCAAPLAGHLYPAFRPTAGGKGISSAFGGLIGLIPASWLALIWAVCVLVSLAVRRDDRWQAMLLSVILFVPLAFFYTPLWPLRATAMLLPGGMLWAFVRDFRREARRAGAR